MEYMTPHEAAEKWGISLRSVQLYCSIEKIPGTKRIGRQWFIPKDAARPLDRRFSESKQSGSGQTYHFPALAFTVYFKDTSVLSEDELALVEAQKLFLYGEYSESIELCRKLIDSDAALWVKFGANCTIIYNSLPLGLYSQIVRCMQKMEEICVQDPAHSEDYRLLIGICRFQYTYDGVLLQSIRVNELSADALSAFSCVTMQTMIFSHTEATSDAIRIYSAFARQEHERGILPAAMAANGMLAMLCERVGDKEGRQSHMDTLCRIGYEERYVTLLSKYSAVMPAEYRKSLSVYGADFARTIEHIRSRNLRNCFYVFHTATGSWRFDNRLHGDYEFLLLLSYGFSNKKIANLKDIPEAEVSRIIRTLCEESGLQSKRQLAAYAKRVFRIQESRKQTDT